MEMALQGMVEKVSYQGKMEEKFLTNNKVQSSTVLNKLPIILFTSPSLIAGIGV